MKDRITKKRIKVDYYKVICMLGLFSDFVKYDAFKSSCISFRRRARAFLKHKHVDLFVCQSYLKDKPWADYSTVLIDHKGDLSLFYEL